MKHLHIVEYSKYGKIPIKEEYEYEFKANNGNIIRSSILDDKKDYTNYEDVIVTYNKLSSGLVDEKIINLNDVIVYDNLDIKDDTQKLVYVLKCPVCLNRTITSDSKIETCPQCGNSSFDFLVEALINQEQMEDVAIENDDVSTLIIVQDSEIKLIDRPKGEEV